MIFVLLISVLVYWLPNTEADLAGYKVYIGERSREYTFMQETMVESLTVEIDILLNFHDQGNFKIDTLFFAVTAYDTAGNESNPSKEVLAIFYTGYKLGDVNGDGIVDLFDFMEAVHILNCRYGEDCYNPAADIKKDSIITNTDLDSLYFRLWK